MLTALLSAARITEPAKWIGIFFLGTSSLQTANSLAADGPAAQTGSAPPASTATAPVRLSSGAAEVIRLAQSGITEDAVLAYVRNYSAPFDCSAEVIIYLTDLGLAPAVIQAMIERDGQLAGQDSRDKAQPPMEPPAPVSAATNLASSPEIADATPEANASNAPAEVNYFYNQLSPYGTWVSLAGTGWCWQPHCYVVSPGWRPYCHGGHWVYTECGWYWQSDYSWGWAPFHYGRWHHHERCGWVWCPDRQWGPAWVTWRVSKDHCGWAPLPPNSVYVNGRGWCHRGVYYKDDCDFGLKANHFTFVAMKDFNSRKLAHDHLAKSAAQNVYERAAIINARTLANNRMLVNAGVPVERVAAATHTDIRKITIRDIPAGSSAAHGLPSASVVFRHELQAPVKPLRLVAPKVDEQHPVLPHPAIVPNGIASKTSGRPNGILHPGRPAPGALPPANPPHQTTSEHPPKLAPRPPHGIHDQTAPPLNATQGPPSAGAPPAGNAPGPSRPESSNGRPPIQRPPAVPNGIDQKAKTPPPPRGLPNQGQPNKGAATPANRNAPI